MRKLRLSFSPSGPSESLFSFKILLLCKPRLLYSVLKQKNMSLCKGNEIAFLHGVCNGYNDTNDTTKNKSVFSISCIPLEKYFVAFAFKHPKAIDFDLDKTKLSPM